MPPGPPWLGVSWDRPEQGMAVLASATGQWASGESAVFIRDLEEFFQAKDPPGLARDREPGKVRGRLPALPDVLLREICMKRVCFRSKGNQSLATACVGPGASHAGAPLAVSSRKRERRLWVLGRCYALESSLRRALG